jgi:hypothetical protein
MAEDSARGRRRVERGSDAPVATARLAEILDALGGQIATEALEPSRAGVDLHKVLRQLLLAKMVAAVSTWDGKGRRRGRREEGSKVEGEGVEGRGVE